jgi:hypothetical protein
VLADYAAPYGAALPLLRIPRIRVEHLRDDPGRELVEVILQGRLERVEFRPERFVDEPLRHPGHHGGPPLAAISVRGEAVAPEQGHEEAARPLVRQGKFVLDGGIDLLDVPQPGEDPLARPFRRDPLSFAARPGEQGLDAPQLLDEPLFVIHPHTSPLSRSDPPVLC